MVDPTPADYRGAIPYLIVSDAAKAIEFYTSAFGATERMRIPIPGGLIGHAELDLAGGVIMLADGGSCPQAAKVVGREGPISLMFYTPDVDAVFRQAIARGAKETQPITNKFYGDRSGQLTDPFGHCWTISTHVEDVTPEEMDQRMKEMRPE